MIHCLFVKPQHKAPNLAKCKLHDQTFFAEPREQMPSMRVLQNRPGFRQKRHCGWAAHADFLIGASGRHIRITRLTIYRGVARPQLNALRACRERLPHHLKMSSYSQADAVKTLYGEIPNPLRKQACQFKGFL